MSLGTGLLAHWRCNDNAATDVVADNRGSYHGASARNTENLAANGKVNGALQFNGTSDVVTFPTNGVPAGMKSVAVWFKAAVLTAGGLIYQGGNSFNSAPSNWPWALWLASGYIFWSGNTDGAGQNFTYTPGTWHHIVLVRDNGDGDAKVYVDGSLFWTGAGQAWSGDASTMYFGNAGAFFCDVALDDIRIYNRALSANEVTSLYNGGAGTESEGSPPVVSPFPSFQRVGL